MSNCACGNACCPGIWVHQQEVLGDMQRAYPAPSDQKNGAESFVTEVADRLKSFELTGEQGHALLDAIRRSVREPEPKFYGPGLASFIVGEQRKCDLNPDAARLAELRELQAATLNQKTMSAEMFGEQAREHERLGVLIAVYEECAARGLTFGGSR